jgi:hypothetical protein
MPRVMPLFKLVPSIVPPVPITNPLPNSELQPVCPSGKETAPNQSPNWLGAIRWIEAVLELVVHAKQDSLEIRLGAESVSCASSTRQTDLACTTASTEAHEVVFQKRRPLRRKHPFKAATNSPTSTIAARNFGNLRARDVGGYVP